MTLGFSKEIKIYGSYRPSHFMQKILTSFGFAMVFVDIDKPWKPKLHTIREDKKDLWKAGNLIHFVYGNRTKNRVCWHVGKCSNVEYIGIAYPPCCEFTVYVFESDKSYGKKLTEEQIYQLAINDGFDSVEDFMGYFDKPFVGKIIHWTDLSYAK